MTIRRQHGGGASGTTLSAGIGTSDTSFTVATGGGASYPDGSVGPFIITVDAGTSSEERLLVASRISDTFAGVTRAYDGTTAKTHAAGAAVAHTLSALELDEANAHLAATADAHAASAITYTPAGGIAATNVQAAITELDSELRTKTVRLPHTWALSGSVAVPSGDTDFVLPFFVPVPAGQTVTLTTARYVINSGTSATVKLQKNGSDVAGFTAISVTTTAASTTGTASFANNDKLALVVTAVSGTPKNLSFTVYLDYAV